MPALPLDDAGQYVAAAYIVFVVLLIIYVGIMAVRLGHLSRELEELTELTERGRDGAGDDEQARGGREESPTTADEQQREARL